MIISVVIPTKNSNATIDKCLSSLMPYYRGGYINEIVVVDGHSTDGTLEVISGYPVNVFFEETKGYIGLAYDTGWRNSKGEVIIFLDSDVEIGEKFFPKIYELLSSDMGWISCSAKVGVTNKLSKAQQEEATLTGKSGSFSPSWFQYLYNKIASSGLGKLPFSGECVVVRRVCLEAVDGYRSLPLAISRIGGENLVSLKIVQQGWKAIQWADAPVYHYPRTTFMGSLKQQYNFGFWMVLSQKEKEYLESCRWYHKIANILARLASPVIGLILAVRFRNPIHIIVYPLPRYAWAWGYIRGWIETKKSNQPVYTESGIRLSK
jgi:glycosyltransferase involved in cell wall biosynthesis